MGRPRKKLLIYCQCEYTASLASFVLRHMERVSVTIATECLEALYYLDRVWWDHCLVLPTEGNREEDLEVIAAARFARVILPRRHWAKEYSSAWPAHVHSTWSNMRSMRAVIHMPLKRGPKSMETLARTAKLHCLPAHGRQPQPAPAAEPIRRVA